MDTMFLIWDLLIWQRWITCAPAVQSTTLKNCGYGHGYSVREVIQSVGTCHDTKLNVIEAERRAGDPPALISNVEAIHNNLNWEPQYDDLNAIVNTALAWKPSLMDEEDSSKT